MVKTNWQKNFRRIPTTILQKLSKMPGDEFVVACVRKIPASVVRNGVFGHLDISMNDNVPVFPGRITPKPLTGKFSQWNVVGREIVHKDLPMVVKTFTAERPNWGDWNNGSHDVSWDRDVYQRDFNPPKDLDISTTLLTTELGEDPVFVFRFRVEEILNKRRVDLEKDLFGNLNLLQENTGFADVFPADANSMEYLKTISVYWEILPPGERTEVLARILSKFHAPSQELKEKLLDRYTFLEKLNPVAYISGTSGFHRYFGAQFADNFVVFENLEYGNAIYAMFDDWEELSKLSRIELLKNRRGTGFVRIVHRDGWKNTLKELVKSRRAA